MKVFAFEGVVIIRGTSSINSLVEILPRFIEEGPNIKIVATISWELFKRQPEDNQFFVIGKQDWQDSMVITNGALRLMQKWIANRTAGSLKQIVKESKPDPDS